MKTIKLDMDKGRERHNAKGRSIGWDILKNREAEIKAAVEARELTNLELMDKFGFPQCWITRIGAFFEIDMGKRSHEVKHARRDAHYKKQKPGIIRDLKKTRDNTYTIAERYDVNVTFVREVAKECGADIKCRIARPGSLPTDSAKFESMSRTDLCLEWLTKPIAARPGNSWYFGC